VVEADPAMSTSLSQKMRTRRRASRAALPKLPRTATLRSASGCRGQQILDFEARSFSETFDLRGQFGHYGNLRREQDAPVKVQDCQAIALVESILGTELCRKCQRTPLANLHCCRTHETTPVRLLKYRISEKGSLPVVCCQRERTLFSRPFQRSR